MTHGVVDRHQQTPAAQSSPGRIPKRGSATASVFRCPISSLPAGALSDAHTTIHGMSYSKLCFANLPALGMNETEDVLWIRRKKTESKLSILLCGKTRCRSNWLYQGGEKVLCECGLMHSRIHCLDCGWNGTHPVSNDFSGWVGRRWPGLPESDTLRQVLMGLTSGSTARDATLQFLVRYSNERIIGIWNQSSTPTEKAQSALRDPLRARSHSSSSVGT